MSDVDWQRLNPTLLEKFEAGPERGGVILPDGSIIELKNHAEAPNEGFQPDPHELLEHVDDVVGTWHTHPEATANLSVEDWGTFVSWPDCHHAIVGTDGVRWYVVKNGAVVNA